MWMIPPDQLCRQHLLGEHGEIHKFRHSFEKKHNMQGRLAPVVQIVPHLMQARHDELAEEMLRRGFKHASPYAQPDVSHLPIVEVDVKYNQEDLSSRCRECQKLMKEANQ